MKNTKQNVIKLLQAKIEHEYQMSKIYETNEPIKTMHISKWMAYDEILRMLIDNDYFDVKWEIFMK